MFLDIINYIAPGYSYAKFLKSWGFEGGDDQKGTFCYSYIDSLEKLDEGRPSRDAFYDTLKQREMTEAEYVEFCHLWENKGFKTIRELLQWYQLQDVGPFLKAVNKMVSFYKKHLRLDLVKDAVSIPGLTLKYLFQSMSGNANFTLFNEKNKDLFDEIRRQITGGPSIIFHRFHESGKTKIRGGENLVKAVIGYDASALYLHSIGQLMPTGDFIRYKPNEYGIFQHEKRSGSVCGRKAREWLAWMSHVTKLHITHKHNGGEVTIVHNGKTYFFDGLSTETNPPTIWEMNGCFYHGHECGLTRSAQQSFFLEKLQALRNKKSNQLQKKKSRKYKR